MPRSSSTSAVARSRLVLMVMIALPASSLVVRPKLLDITDGMDQNYIFALVVEPGNGLCRAGFAGVVPRAVFPFVVVRPKMLCIMAGMTQRDSY